MVDDEPDVVKAIVSRLKGEGYEVITASGGKEALDKVRSQRPDLMLLDIIMPGMDGIEVLQQLKEIDPDLPVVIITAHPSLEPKDILKYGASGYIKKPFESEELKGAIKEGLEEKKETKDVQKNFSHR